MSDQPPFSITPKIVDLISVISEWLGKIDSLQLQHSTQLRKQNRIKTISSTLAIEGNTLSLDQVTAIIEGKHVLGEAREIAEVKGAIQAYETLDNWKAWSVDDLLTGHKMMMQGLLNDSGRFRSQGVGIHKGEQVVHIAPPSDRVGVLMNELMEWVKSSDQHPLIVSSVFHYELEFIHPFMDGNGRMGRLWQTLILGQWKEIFYLLPLESVIKDHQQAYYDVLTQADHAADSTIFVEFMLQAILEVLQQSSRDAGTTSDQVSDQASDQVKKLLSVMDKQFLSSKELMERLKLSHRATFRKNYLNPAIEAGLVEMSEPQSPRNPKQKYRKSG